MKRNLPKLLIAILTFGIGMAINRILNYSADTLIEYSETACAQAKTAVVGQERDLISLPVSDCSQILVRIRSDHTVYVDGESKDSLEDADELTDRLRAIFRIREELRFYRAGVEPTADIPEDQRVEKTV